MIIILRKILKSKQRKAAGKREGNDGFSFFSGRKINKVIYCSFFGDYMIKS